VSGAAFQAQGAYADRKPLGQQIVRVMTTTDHKLIGKLYLGTSFMWFLLGGIMALIIRSELAFPGQQVVNDTAVLRLRQPGHADPDRCA
jgi:cytochrome c oxidase subunit 1